MSRLLENDNGEFSLGDIVSFRHKDWRLTGEIVRVYNTRLVYHVEVKGRRYEVVVPDDDIQREDNGRFR